MDEKTKAQIQQEAADLVAKLQPRSMVSRLLLPTIRPIQTRFRFGSTSQDA